MVALPPAFAHTVDSKLQRDVNQQNRIEQGLQSGQRAMVLLAWPVERDLGFVLGPVVVPQRASPA